jgi:hypothetical protein
MNFTIERAYFSKANKYVKWLVPDFLNEHCVRRSWLVSFIPAMRLASSITPERSFFAVWQRLFRKQQHELYRAIQRTNHEIVELLRRLGSSKRDRQHRRSGANRSGPDCDRPCDALADSARHGNLHGRLLLPKTASMPGLFSLRRHLHALLLQAHAVPWLLPMRRHLRALLLQADAMPLQSASSTVQLFDAGLLWLGTLDE